MNEQFQGMMVTKDYRHLIKRINNVSMATFHRIDRIVYQKNHLNDHNRFGVAD